ncbi:MAG: T9SS type A sorting domain-containing protein, partial [bacterium]|nr:T9SS type A sorting domain-containing protein [bacterium]
TGEPGTGSLQANASYTVSLSVPSDSIHYLRVRTKDNAGNWSSAATLFTFRYDSTSPSVPTAPCNAWTNNSQAVAITNNIWQNLDASPYFEWSGAEDTGSGVKGYKVYWGTNPAGIPTDWQTGTNLTTPSDVESPSIYYLRIMTQDAADNWSTSTTLFVFRYDAQAPTNPITPCAAYVSSTNTITISHNTWQSTDGDPYFMWTGDGDASGSGVAGYAVSWSQNEGDEPGFTVEQSKNVYEVTSRVGTMTTYYLRIRTIDKADNYSPATTLFTLKYDPELPTNPTGCKSYGDANKLGEIYDNTWQNMDNTPYFEWSGAAAGSGVAGYTVYWGTSSTGEPGTGNIQTGTHSNISTPVPTNSIYYLRVRTKSNSDQWSEPNTLFVFKYDATLPNNPISCTGWKDIAKQENVPDDVWQNQYNTPYFDWSDAIDTTNTGTSSGVAGYIVYWGTSSTGEPGTGMMQTATNTTAATILSNSTYYLRIATKDNAGNWSNAVTLFTFKYDSTGPTNPVTPCNAWADSSKNVAITNDIWQNKDATPYFEWNGATDSSSGIAGYSVYWGTSSTGEPGTGSLQANASYTVSSSVPSDSIYYLRVRTKDNAGNWSSAITLFTFRYDFTGPINPVTPCNAWTDSSRQIQLLDNTWQNKSANPYFEWNGAADIGSGIAGYSVYWGTSSTIDPGTTSLQTTTNYIVTTPVPSNTVYYLRLRTRDQIGNWSEPITLFTFKYDATPPNNPGTPCNAWADSSRAMSITNNIWQNTDDTPYFEWSEAIDSQPGSGVEGYAVYWGILSTGDPGTNTIQTQANYTVNTSVGSQATYYLRVRTRDNVGNWSQPETLFIFRYNVSGLPAPEKLMANGANPSNWQYSPTFSIDWTNPQTDVDLKGVWYKLGEKPSYGTDGTFIIQKPFSVTANKEGGQTLYLWLEDNLGNKDHNLNSTVILQYDQTSPQNPATCTAYLFKGTTTTIPDNTWQNIDAALYFEWNIPDDMAGSNTGSGIMAYSIAWKPSMNDDPGTISLRTTSSYEDSTPLSEDIRYLQIRTKDMAGNWSTTTTLFTFKYDNTSPPAPISLKADNKEKQSPWKNTSEFEINVVFPDDPSGISRIQYCLGTGSSKYVEIGTLTNAYTFTVEAINEVQENKGQILSVWLMDGAGNAREQSVNTVELMYDKTPPMISRILYDDRNKNSLVDKNDKIEIVFNEIISYNLLSLDNIFELKVTGDNWGAGANIYPQSSESIGTNTMVVMINLGSGTSLSISGIYSSGSITHGSPSGIGLKPTQAIKDRAGNPATVTVASFENHDVIDMASPRISRVIYRDRNNPGVTKDDEIIVFFTEDINVVGDITSGDFHLCVQGDTFGNGATFSVSGSNSITIKLGDLPHLKIEGEFGTDSLASGMDINESLAHGHIMDYSENDAQAWRITREKNGVDIVFEDKIPPTIENILPHSGDTVNELPVISVWLRDVGAEYNSGIATSTIKICVDGIEKTTGIRIDFNEGTPQGTFTRNNLTVTFLEPLSPGEHTIGIYVRDKRDNESLMQSVSFIVKKTDEPVMEIANYPNPFSPLEGTIIQYILNKSSEVSIYVYDISGDLIGRVIENQIREIGVNKERWDGKSVYGKILPNGVYLCEIVIDNKPKKYIKIVVYEK